MTKTNQRKLDATSKSKEKRKKKSICVDCAKPAIQNRIRCIRHTKGTRSKGVPEVSFPIELFNKYPKIYGDKLIAAFDSHCPYHSEDTWNKLIEFNKQFKADTLLIVGDLLDYKGLYSKDVVTTTISWITEVKETVKFLEFLSKHFDRIIITRGNHDWRLIRHLKNQVDADALRDMIFNNPKITFSNYYYAEVNDDIVFNHPDNGRKLTLSLADELSLVHGKSVINAHTHRFAFGISRSGKVIGDGLHTTEPDFHEYKNVKLTIHSQWVPGWWCVQKDQVFPFVIHDKVFNPYLYKYRDDYK